MKNNISKKISHGIVSSQTIKHKIDFTRKLQMKLFLQKNAQSESSLHRSATGRGAWEDPAGEEQGAGVQSQTATSCHRRPGPGD